MESIIRKIKAVHRAENTSDGAGVRLKRSIGLPDLDYIDPFLLLDEFSSSSADDYIAGFPSHPHRGFETVTYMLNGSMQHEDSSGNSGLLVTGSVQWMTAGSGVIHSEMPKQKDGLMRGFQLWINLPSKDKMMKPRYQDIPPDKIPEVRLANGGIIKVIAGEAEGVIGPVSGIVTEPLYVDINLPPGQEFSLPVKKGHSVFAYPFEGSVLFTNSAASNEWLDIRKSHLAEFEDGDLVVAKGGREGGRFILLAAKPLGEEIYRHGPFVMTTREEIMTAVREYNNGTFLQ